VQQTFKPVCALAVLKGRWLRAFQKAILLYILATTGALTLVLAFFGARLEVSHGTRYGDLSVDDAKLLMDSTPSLIIVDVRTAAEFSLGHIENAVNLCVCNEEHLLLNLQPEDEILVYCLSGTRSLKAKMILNEHGYGQVYNLLGGISEWVEQGYPVVG